MVVRRDDDSGRVTAKTAQQFVETSHIVPAETVNVLLVLPEETACAGRGPCADACCFESSSRGPIELL